MDLPTTLVNDPLVETVFEFRFAARSAVSTILPGMLSSAFQPSHVERRMPQADIPEAIRAENAELKYLSMTRIVHDPYGVLIADRAVAIACNQPYPGWPPFKEQIVKLLEVVAQADVVSSVERFALRTVNLLPKEYGTPIDLINYALRLGSVDVTKQFRVTAEVPDGDTAHALHLESEGEVAADLAALGHAGCVIDIDSIVKTPNMSFNAFTTVFSERIDGLHEQNRSQFFKLLTDKALTRLGPRYD